MDQLGYGDAGPFGDHLGDVVFGDLFAQHGFIAAAGIKRLFFGRQFLVQLGQGAVFELGGLVEVVVALGLLHLQLNLLDLFFDGAQLIDRALFCLPLGIEGALLFA